MPNIAECVTNIKILELGTSKEVDGVHVYDSPKVEITYGIGVYFLPEFGREIDLRRILAVCFSVCLNTGQTEFSGEWLLKSQDEFRIEDTPKEGIPKYAFYGDVDCKWPDNQDMATWPTPEELGYNGE